MVGALQQDKAFKPLTFSLIQLLFYNALEDLSEKDKERTLCKGRTDTGCDSLSSRRSQKFSCFSRFDYWWQKSLSCYLLN